MKIDIGKIDGVEGLLPWDLTLTVEGQDYPTRRPTVGEVAQLETVAGMQSNADGMTVVGRILFAEPRPDLGAWSVESVIGAITAFTSYFNARAEKKLGAPRGDDPRGGQDGSGGGPDLIWDLVLNVCRLLSGMKPSDVLAMDALLMTALCGAARRQAAHDGPSAGGGRGTDGDGQWQTDPNTGRKTLRIRSMETLGRVLGGGIT